MNAGADAVTLRLRKRGSLLGDAIREAREKRKWSQTALAKASGVSRKHLSDLENGANVSVDVVKKVAKALNLWSIHIGDDMVMTLEDGQEVGYVEVQRRIWSIVELLTQAYSTAEELYSALTPGRPSNAEEIAAGDVTLVVREPAPTVPPSAVVSLGPRPVPADVSVQKADTETDVSDERLLLWDEVPPSDFKVGDWDYTQTWRGGEISVSEGIAAGAMEDFDALDETADVLNTTLRDVRGGRFGVTRVKGRSMEPRLHDGDLVLIDTFDKTPRPGRIMAIYRKGEGSAFGYLHKSGELWLLAKANAAEFSPIPLTGEFMIRGVVKKRLEEDLE